jgi:hypothetical protein
MNYYLIPKSSNELEFNVKLTNEYITPYISNSVFYHVNNMKSQINELKNECENDVINNICKIVHPCCFVYSNVQGSTNVQNSTNVQSSTMNVNKMNINESVVFELIEIFYNFKLKELFENETINTYIFSNSIDSILSINELCPFVSMNVKLGSKIDDIFDNMSFENVNANDKTDLIIYEIVDKECYFKNIVLCLLIIFNYQNNNGISIIKIDDIYDRLVVEFIYILSSIYKKVYLMKPIVCDVTNESKYIVCINYTNKNDCINDKLLNYVSCSYSFDTIIENDIPIHFINKLEDVNALIGYQQLEAYDQIINLYNNKNRDEKIEIIKRNNIQKSVQWCDKYNIPHNKFSERTNIFLMSKSTSNDVNVFNRLLKETMS